MKMNWAKLIRNELPVRELMAQLNKVHTVHNLVAYDPCCATSVVTNLNYWTGQGQNNKVIPKSKDDWI